MSHSGLRKSGWPLGRVSVCIPARNEVATIAGVVSGLEHLRVEAGGFINEVIVMDHDSQDETAVAARMAGAQVIAVEEIAPWAGPCIGKGDVLWRSLQCSEGDVVVWLDADLTNIDSMAVVRLVAPLIDPGVALVKARHVRSLNGVDGEGGRVTELGAKPLLSLLFPQIAHIDQPLSGQCAIRRDVAEQLTFEVDYGVEVGALIDVAGMLGPDSIAQAEIGVLEHRHRPLRELAVQSQQVSRAILSRAGHRGLAGAVVGRPPVAALRMPVG